MWTLLLLWLSSLHMYVPQFSCHTAEFGEENVVNVLMNLLLTQ